MNIPTVLDWRNKRNLNHLSVQSMNYSTYSLPDFTENKNMKGEIYDMYRPDIETFSEMVTDKKIDRKSEKSEPWLIRSALHMCTMIYRKISGRASSPELSYHDCEALPGRESPPGFWQSARTENKNSEARIALSDRRADMNGGYDGVVASCEDKLNKVRQLITSKSVPSSPKCTTYKSRRRRRVFVESSSVEDCFEDAFSPEDFISESNSEAVTFIIPYQYQNCELFEVDAHKMKIENSSTNVKSQSVPENKKDLNLNVNVVKKEVFDTIKPEEPNITNIETVSSCESKILQLQAMLKQRCKKNTKTVLNSSDSAPEPVKDLPTEHTKPKIIPTPKIQDKRYKNCHRLSTGKRKKAETKKLISEDMLFADEIAEEPSSFENSPIITVALDKSVESLGSSADDCFDEVAGRFRTASGTDSDDSFQVVFTDSPRAKRPSDCESEDSFIVFEESPDSCYTSNDVFGDESDSDYSDSDSDVSDSGCGGSDELKMSQNMTKTFGDLTDNSLYDDKDEVDNAVNICAEIPSDELELVAESAATSTGLLLTEAKKLLRKNQPPKKVRFSSSPPAVRVLRVWAFAARQARAGHWERHALDRERFKRRIADADMALSWVLRPQHRARVLFQRVMPWRHAQRHRELAEQRAREEQARVEDNEIDHNSKEETKEQANVEEGKIVEEKQATVGDENKIIDGVAEERGVEKCNTEEQHVGNKGNNDSDKSEIGNGNSKESISEIVTVLDSKRTSTHSNEGFDVNRINIVSN